MKVVLAGGSGNIGSALQQHFLSQGHSVVVLSRSGHVRWDGKTLGPWADEIDGADVVMNLAGRTVNCRYNERNLAEMMSSRVDSTRVVGEAIAAAKRPPKVWLQASTATIYAHRYDKANDEIDGIIAGAETDAPRTWRASIDIAFAWERELELAQTPSTRKVALRTAMTMSPDAGSVFAVLAGLTRRGLGGRLGDGRQFVSWIHERDFCRASSFVIDHEELAGPINFCSPNPLPQAEFASVLRSVLGVKIGLPALAWMVELGTIAMRTESELVMKSRRVVPRRLLEAGFKFEFPDWRSAAIELAARLNSKG